jgi:hypothetical protein
MTFVVARGGSIRNAALLVGAYALACFNLMVPVVRLTPQILNYLAFGAVQLIPLAVIGNAMSQRGWTRWPTLAVGAVLFVLSLPLGVGAVGCAALAVPVDPSFEQLQVVRTDHGNVVAYRTNGGATTAFGMVVRQECVLLPGVRLVRELAREYPSHDAAVQWQAPGQVRVSFANSGSGTAGVRVRAFPLRRVCWGPAV